MADVHRLPDERAVTEEASRWIARLHSDDVTAEDHARFGTWRNAHPMHARAFDELAGTWNRFNAARSLVRAVAFGQSMNEAASRGAADKGRIRSPWHRLRWAAVIVAITTSLGLFVSFRLNPAGIYVTAIGEHATVSLPDGSTLELDSDSRARVNFSARHRVVHLERGEAFFKVAHDAQRPFWVVGGSSWVRAVGTAFNVDLYPAGMRVTVSEGTVKVGALGPLVRNIPLSDGLLSDSSAISVLTAGKEADLQGASVQIRPLTPAQLARAVSWRAGTLYFEDAPLSEVVDELKRYTPLDLVISGEHIHQLRIAGTFQASPQGVEVFLRMLDQGLGLTVRQEPGRVVIEPARETAH